MDTISFPTREAKLRRESIERDLSWLWRQAFVAQKEGDASQFSLIEAYAARYFRELKRIAQLEKRLIRDFPVLRAVSEIDRKAELAAFEKEHKERMAAIHRSKRK